MGNLAEQSVIGCLLMDNKMFCKVQGILKPDMFKNPVLKEIYKEIAKSCDIGHVANIVTVSQAVVCDAYPTEYIGQILKECIQIPFTSVEIMSYAESIVKDYKASMLNEILSHTQVSAPVIEQQIAELIHSLESLKRGEKCGAKKISEIVGEQQGLYFKEREEDKLYIGFSKLDDITGGLEGGDVIVIGARPGVGKSAFTSQIILKMAKAGKRIGFYNLEMSEKQVYERLLSNQSGIRLSRIRRAVRFLGDEKERFDKANTALGGMDILVSSGTKSISDIRNECRYQELDCIVICSCSVHTTEGYIKSLLPVNQNIGC